MIMNDDGKGGRTRKGGERERESEGKRAEPGGF